MPGSWKHRGDFVMKAHKALFVSGTLLLLASTAFAEEVTLPAPVLEWAVYIVLIFAVCVAVGISIAMKNKNGPGDSLGSLLDDQNPIIHSVRPNVSVTSCVSRMNELQIGAMLVMEDDQLIGIFTERDALTRVLGAGLDPTSTEISTVMTKDPVWASTSTTLEEARTIVTNRRIRHLPVLRDGKVLGVVSSGDLTHSLVKDAT
jgi:CBS domain-containing protein